MADSASLVSISFRSSSIFIFFVEWLMLSLFFHFLALFLFFFFFFCSLTVYCALYSLPRSLLGPTLVYPLDLLGGLRSTDENECSQRGMSVGWNNHFSYLSLMPKKIEYLKKHKFSLFYFSLFFFFFFLLFVFTICPIWTFDGIF